MPESHRTRHFPLCAAEPQSARQRAGGAIEERGGGGMKKYECFAELPWQSNPGNPQNLPAASVTQHSSREGQRAEIAKGSCVHKHGDPDEAQASDLLDHHAKLHRIRCVAQRGHGNTVLGDVDRAHHLSVRLASVRLHVC